MRSATVSGRKEKVPAPKDNFVLIGGKEQNKSHVSCLPWLRIAWEEMTDKRRNCYETQLESEEIKPVRHSCTHVCDVLCHLHRDAGTMYSQQYCLPGWGSA